MFSEDPTLPPAPSGTNGAPARRPRGRPLEMSREEVLRRIAALATEGSLFRVHHEHPALYARARRQFGTWSRALEQAGVDPARTLDEARRRSQASRRTGGDRNVNT